MDAELFEVERLLAAAQSSRTCSAEAVQHSILAAVDRFVGDAAQFDDMALLAVVREPEPERNNRIRAI